jgi:hypothetical protein
MKIFAGINHWVDAFSFQPGFTHNRKRVLKIEKEIQVYQITENRFFKDLNKEGFSVVRLPFFF